MNDSQNIVQSMLKSLQTLPHVAKNYYKVTGKGTGILPLDFTTIQHRILVQMQWLLETRGRIDYNVVKPRQIRCTTLLNAAEFKLSNDIPGLRTLLLTHRAVVTSEIFENLKRFQEQLPEHLRQETTKNNDEKLFWKNLSGIVCGTMGTDSGRGFPCFILHLSELGRARDRHVKDVQEGAMNAHASTYPGSMLVVESTSGGQGNFFHERCKKGYRAPMASTFTAFFGWNEEPDYRLPPPKGWAPDSEEVRIMKQLDLDIEQIYWRNQQLDKMRGNVTAFQREFPATFEEAFASAEGKLIDAVVLLNALNSKTAVDPSQVTILGVDPAGQGDRTAMVKRQGFVMPKHWVYNKMDDVTLANIIDKVIEDEGIDYVFIDMGYGHGTYNILRSRGRTNVIGIYFGSKPDPENQALYLNKRAEMAGRFQDWMEEGPDGVGGTARIPDDREFERDIAMMPDLQYSGTAQKFMMPPKEEIKAELGKSPDIFDAAILTFAQKVHRKRIVTTAGYGNQQQGQSMLTTENVFQELGAMTEPGQQNANFRYYSFGGN